MWDMVHPINRHNVLIINDDICPMDSRDIYNFFDTNSIAELYDIEFYKHPECEYNVDEDKYYPTGYAIIYIDYWYDTTNSSSFYNSLIDYHTNNKDKDNVFVFRTSGHGPPWKIELYYNYENHNDVPHKKQNPHSYTLTPTQENKNNMYIDTRDNYNDLFKKQKISHKQPLTSEYTDQVNNNNNDNHDTNDNNNNDNDNDNDDNDDNDDNEYDGYQFSEEEEEEEEEEEYNDYQDDDYLFLKEEKEKHDQNIDENIDLCFDIINFINLKNNYRTIHKKYYNLIAVNQSLVKRNKELVKSLKKNKKNTWYRRLRNLN